MKKLAKALSTGRTFSQYFTSESCDSSYYRYDDTKEVIHCKSVVALVERGLFSWDDIKISKEIIK